MGIGLLFSAGTVVGINMARIWHRNKCLMISTSYLASVTILTLSHRALSGSQWEGMEDWMAGNTECNCQPFVAAKWNVSNMLKSFCGPTADLRGPGQRVLSFSLYGKMVQEGSGDWQMLEYIKGIVFDRNKDSAFSVFSVPFWHISVLANVEYSTEIWCFCRNGKRDGAGFGIFPK